MADQAVVTERAEKARLYATVMNDRLRPLQDNLMEQTTRRLKTVESDLDDRFWEHLKSAYTAGYKDGFVAGVSAEAEASAIEG